MSLGLSVPISCALETMLHCGTSVRETHPSLVILGPVIREGVSVAHVLSAIAGVDGKLVLCCLGPQVHHVPQVRLQFLKPQ